jgi:hypothetical protein
VTSVHGQLTSGRAAIVRSQLVAEGGFVVTRLLRPAQTDTLRREAVVCHRRARACRIPEPPAGPEARGQPDRWLDVAVGGPRLEEFFCSTPMLEMLADLTDAAWTPHGTQGTYSYYRAEGHYLGVHRDAVGCDLAVITCLSDTTPGAGGNLIVYPGAATRSLGSLRADLADGARAVRLCPGESAILLGSLVPHRVAPTAAGQVRVVAPLCYALATPDRPVRVATAERTSARAVASPLTSTASGPWPPPARRDG